MIYLEDDLVQLERLAPEHELPFLAAANNSTQLHYPYVNPPLNSDQFARFCSWNDFARNAYMLAVHKLDGGLIGMVNFNEIIRGLFQNAFLGYYGFEPKAGQGLMYRSLALGMHFAKEQLDLHRIEAHVQANNLRSLKLVKALGFEHEGDSKQIIRVQGQWCDHQRWALLLY